MVSEGALSQPSSPTTSSDDDLDTASMTSSYDGAVVLRDDTIADYQEEQEPPSFGNVSVVNSSDIHFGNKTFYQGPVTIKQFLYANGKAICDKSDENVKGEVVLSANGLDNSAFVGDLSNETIGKSVNQEPSPVVLKGFRRARQFSKDNFIILVSLLAILLVSLVILMLVLLVRHPNNVEESIVGLRPDSDEQEKNTPVDSPVDPAANLTLPNKLKLVSRLEWVAQPPIQPANKLPVPVPYVIIMHTATENCSSQAQCVFHVRYIQTFHIESRQWWDIGYNFLVGGDGEAYEGRGWTSEGAHTYGYNTRSIGIAFIGTFITSKPPQRQITACKQLIAKGVELGYIQKNYTLLGAKQLQATQSPGAALYEDMKTWGHWAPAP